MGMENESIFDILVGCRHSSNWLCLFSRDSLVALPIGSLNETWKVKKCRLQRSYKSSDEFTSSVAPKLRSGRVWNAEEVEADSDLVCESMLEMLQLGHREGICFGDWNKPWEKMWPSDEKKAAIEPVGENLQRDRDRDRVVAYGRPRASEWVGQMEI